MIDIPLGLRTSIETQNCVLFVGAGIGHHFKTPDGNNAPDGKELCQLLCDKFSIDYKQNRNLSQIAEFVELKKGRKELETFITSKLNGLTPDETFKWITTVRWKSIYTTNYDNCIERAYQMSNNPLQNPISFSITSDIKYHQPIIDVPIYHIHGYMLSEDNSNIIITKTDYAKFRKKRQMLFELLKAEMVTASILYVGYSNTDPNWEILLEETLEDFYPSVLPQSYRIDPYTDEVEIELLQNNRIHTIKNTFQEFVDSIATSIAKDSTIDNILYSFKRNVPPDLLIEFEKSPIPITRLLSSWEYVNQSIFNEPPNLNNFLKGDIPNWTLIDNELFFERDIQSELYDTILDFATTTKEAPNAVILLGAAGYGTTTLLKILAVKIIKENAGAVFLLRSGAQILEGDIEYATTLFPNVFFIIDNAADFANDIEKAIHVLKESKKRAFFLLGDRLNEWHQCTNRPRGQEFQIEPLSDCEIERLLDFLGKHQALNQLEHLPYDIQFSAIKERHQKELLVVMREATENNNFDAIIESEYRGIGDEFSKLFYLYVCSFYQHGALIRDTLLAEIFKINITELYDKISKTTEGVVLYECIDTTRGLYAIRARHHKIAAVVWERCADYGIKETVVQQTITKLNLNYGIDARAFEIFVRSDRIVDCIQNLEGKISFFEQACKMDPMSPYVRQHYARMLSRAGQQPLALMQIDNAIKNDQTVKVLYHTKGKILSELSLNADSIDIGRKYLLQAETCFKKGISSNDRDDYCFESLSSLYFDWSKKMSRIDNSESADYLSKAEEMISSGLRTVRNREALWVLSSKIQLYLGNTPHSISALETAVRERSGCVIARYVLACSYRQSKEPQKALTILEPVIKSSTDEFRAFIEYSLALIDQGESYQKASSILQLSTLYGLGDPRFISVYGGMLYLNENFSDADEIFNRSLKHAFPANELYEIHFKPMDRNDPTKPFTLKGEVISVKPGYSLIKPDDYPQIICHASKYKGILMKKGLRITFNLAFCAKGPVALYPIPIINC